MTTYEIPDRKVFKELPFDVVDFKGNENNKTSVFDKDSVFVGPKRYVETAAYKKYGLDIYNFQARPDDVYLMGYPRSGTTLHCEMIWLIGNDLDYEGAARNFMDYRFPHIDFHIMPTFELMDDVLKNDSSDETLETVRKYHELTLEGLSKREGRRFIKSHLPLSVMPPHIFEVGAKVIYCARNPKDVLISIYRTDNSFKYSANMPTYGFKNWFHDFNNDLMWNCPYFEHVKEGWERRNDNNFLFLFYEDTIEDKRQTILKVADFLGKKLSKDQIDTLENYLDIDNFKDNKSVNLDQLVKIGLFEDSKFIRKGRPGGWRELFDDDMVKEFDEIMEKKLIGTDLKFPNK